MISVSDFRNGITFEMDGKVMQIVEFQHVKPGKGAAFVRVKMKNVITGAVTETTFNPMISIPRLISKERKWNILMPTAASTTSWTWRPMR